jgi:hypothetical protein
MTEDGQGNFVFYHYSMREDFMTLKIWIKQQKYNFKRRKGSYSYGRQGSYVYTNPKDVEKGIGPVTHDKGS